MTTLIPLGQGQMISHPGDTAAHLLGTRTATYGNSYISWGQVSVLSKLTRETEHDLVLSLAALGSPQQARDAVSVSQTCPAWTPLRCPLKPQPLRPPALPWRNVSKTGMGLTTPHLTGAAGASPGQGSPEPGSLHCFPPGPMLIPELPVATSTCPRE